jgi:4-amino-4-deoxy-L-arabinose transferase-like glycosyltransferase
MNAVDRREVVSVCTLMAAGAALLTRQAALPSTEFDEQVYLASADLLTRGFELGRDVFTSQPPLFLSVLAAANELAGGDATTLRLMSVLLTMAGALAAWAIVRSRAGALPALATAALVVLAPGVVEAAAVVSADVPSVALGTVALLAAHRARGRPVWGLAAGALLACAVLTKLLALPFAVALAAGAVPERPPRRAIAWFLLGIGAVAAAVALLYADVLGALWHGAVVLHLHARDAPVQLPRPSILVTVLLIVLAYVGMLAVLAAGVLEVGRGRLGAWMRQRADLLALTGAGIVLCALQRPLLNHHLVIVAWPLALLAGSSLPARLTRSRRTLAIAGLGALLVVPWAVHGRDTVAPGDARALQEAAAQVAASTSPSAAVVSDLPAVTLLARRRSAAATVDPSYVRVQTGELSQEEIVRAARAAEAVVVGRSFRDVPGLRTALARRFARFTTHAGIAVWTDPRT